MKENILEQMENRISKKKRNISENIEKPIETPISKGQEQNITKKVIVIKDMKITLLKELGRGGFSEVYDGLVLNRSFAIKRMVKRTTNSDGSKDEKVKKWLERAIKEGNVGCNLRHKNVLRVVHHGAYQEEPSLYEYIIVMQKAINSDLNKLIQSHVNPLFYKLFFGFDQLSDNFCRFFLVQCLNASLYFYICQLIHLDIKPENYLLHKDFSVKLSDFSLVTSLHNQSEDFTFSGVSSPSYMAPEFMLGKTVKKEDAHKADLYSIGITLLYMKFHKRLAPKNCVIDENTVIKAKEEKNKIIDISVKNGTLSKECGDLIELLTKENYKERPDIYQVVNNDWINRNNKKIKCVQLYNEGEPLKFCLEMQKSDYISSITPFVNRKYKLKRRKI